MKKYTNGSIKKVIKAIRIVTTVWKVVSMLDQIVRYVVPLLKQIWDLVQEV